MTSSISKRNHGRGHSYKVDGQKMPGVTSILSKTMPKEALINWAATTTANAAVDRWADLSELPPSKRLKELLDARFADRDQAANRGTQVHELAEAYIRDQTIDIPDELDGHVRSYEQFVRDWQPKPVAVEFVIAHRQVGYCGTVDLLADLNDGHRWLLDIKTSRSGIFAETALQLTAYEHAEVYVDDNGDEQPMSGLGIDRVAAIHVTPDGYKLIPILQRDEIWSFYRHLCWLYYRQEDQSSWLGAPVSAPRQRVSA